MSELCRELGTKRNQGLKMLRALDRSGLLALVPRIDEGVKRETCFYTQVRHLTELAALKLQTANRRRKDGIRSGSEIR